jgi:hypothetical protein
MKVTRETSCEEREWIMDLRLNSTSIRTLDQKYFSHERACTLVETQAGWVEVLLANSFEGVGGGALVLGL